jgi:hypothetical protein
MTVFLPEIGYRPKPSKLVSNARFSFLDDARHRQVQPSMMLAARIVLQTLAQRASRNLIRTSLDHVDDLFNSARSVEEMLIEHADL